MSSFKAKLAEGKTLRVFAVARIPSPVIVEIFGAAGGFDGFWMDQEHGGLTYEQIQTLALAGRANNFDCIVRMAPSCYSIVTQALEVGVGGVMAARIESADHAEQFVQWAKFAPRGSRGLNASGRDADFTFKPAAQFAEDANRDTLVAIQIETLGALNDVDAIAANDGVDLLFVGPSDLSQALGILGQFQNQKLWDAYAAVAAACRKHGKAWGTVCATPEFADRVTDLGCQMVNLGSDVQSLRRGIEFGKTAFARQFAL